MSARLPLFVDLSGRRVLVVGGGRAAERKPPALLGAGALITLIAPKVSEEVRRLLHTSLTSQLLRRRASVRDVTEEYALLFPLTDDRGLNQRLSIAARAAKVWVAGSTDPDGADFHLGAVVDRGPVRLAISTGGGSPAPAGLAAQVLRQRLPKSLAGDGATLRRARQRITRTLSNTVRRQAALLQAVAALEGSATVHA
ncbi:MAG TPA: bifunctional precorrin-2 dehydrogenase/sirohydrochlorin ferrochelatase [Polyangia bacterium]|jgi:siroheme synthase, N-terminal domain|nr:bifunctional precorrin-2 dehydrogenase/sirohydrochlorin ferrochelatase [Polyangia bacterium]